ncbi:hypothetical protein C464_14145 [Halorubrum coriense DSM 10284]|uniref:Gins51 C-terminal domain-containing protein n=1 Tax=Halorubrum coriense DSM 10284 TaxID=1227466 RepID=M0EC51_9EURY|nr:hypothetical protein [Halorubrum coriense]ELZ43984.1 hypothetical protein C464_14145 [Halorubrum coriense DSM 10284]
MNLDELRSAQAKERRKDSLQHLRDSFYDDVGAYVADLRAARDRRAEQVENPFADDDIRRLSDEVETAEEVAEALYERRVGKVVKLASFAAADMSVDEEGMTAEERRLFDDLVDRITANKSEVLDVLAGESPATGDLPTDDGAPTGDDPSASRGPDALGGESTATDSASTDPTPTDPTPADADAGPADTGDGAAVSDTLAGAMGGSEAASPPAEESAIAGGDDSAAAAPGPTEGPAGDGADEPTPVPPEPAPPGAVGVDDAGEEADGAAADRPASDAAEGAESGATTDGGPIPEPTAGGGSGTERSVDRATVRITRDVGAIFGVDEREYDLASEDVVSLPVENADPLVQRDAAERLD